MKKLICLLMLISSTAFGQGQDLGPKNANLDLGYVLNGQDLQAARGFNIFFPKLEGWGLLTLFFSVTDANDSVTDLTMKCFSKGVDEPFKLTGITRANCSTKVITLQYNGKSKTLTEATDWARGADDAASTTNLTAAINAIAGTPFVATKGAGAATSILVTPTAGIYSVWLYSSDATCATANNGLLRSSLQDGTTSSGAFTSYDATWIASNSSGEPLANAGSGGQKQWPWRVDISNLRELRCTVTPSGTGTSIDLIYATARLATK